MNQAQHLLEILRDHPEGVSALELLIDHRIYRAAARIWDLRRGGAVIETTRSERGVARYRLVREQLEMDI